MNELYYEKYLKRYKYPSKKHIFLKRHANYGLYHMYDIALGIYNKNKNLVNNSVIVQNLIDKYLNDYKKIKKKFKPNIINNLIDNDDKVNHFSYVFSFDPFIYNIFKNYYQKKFNKILDLFKITDKLLDETTISRVKSENELITYFTNNHYYLNNILNMLALTIGYYTKKIKEGNYIYNNYNITNICYLKKKLAKDFFNHGYLVYFKRLYKIIEFYHVSTYIILLLYCNLYKIKVNYKDIKYEYKRDKIISKGEIYVFFKLLSYYKYNPNFLIFFHEFELPIKNIQFLSADFYCLVINKKRQLEKIVIEFHGEQHYNDDSFYNKNNKYLKNNDSIKKKFCIDNNITFIELNDNNFNMLMSLLDDIIL